MSRTGRMASDLSRTGPLERDIEQKYATGYGPFWICTSLIFVATSISTFVTYIAHKLKHQEWNYDINVVTWSAGLFYGYAIFVPLYLLALSNYFALWTFPACFMDIDQHQ